jgi:hypothetical protein
MLIIEFERDLIRPSRAIVPGTAGLTAPRNEITAAPSAAIRPLVLTAAVGDKSVRWLRSV